MVANLFRQKQPKYYIKIASDNPLNPENKPEPLELQLMQRYRKTNNKKAIIEIGTIHGKQFLVSAHPSISKPGCLVCHGSADNAPAPITRKYGTHSGYDYQLGSVVGVMLVGVPLQNVNSLVLQRSFITLGLLTLIFGLIAIIISSVVKYSIVAPVVAVTEMATVLSKGKLEQTTITEQESIELNELVKAFDRLRLSVSVAMKRLQNS
ncbi:hypothetical protein TI05_15830 [Achromatium sp. WMS3]|nr:hypothetical protein TI05_15830 [Achromatium sp. WMS3]